MRATHTQAIEIKPLLPLSLCVLALFALGLPVAGQYLHGDFNGDGYTDLAIGAPNESISGVHGAGAVNVIYGSPDGLAADTLVADVVVEEGEEPPDPINGNQIWHQDVPGIGEEPEIDDGFGSALASGDFDGDGYDDLVIGVHLEDVDDELANGGLVHVIYGTEDGLAATDSQLWHQDVSDIEDEVEAEDAFGFSLATGDFNADGYTDLAIGVPNEAVGAVAGAGAVNVIYGSPGGLTAAGDQIWHQNSFGILGAANSGDQFGFSLAGGDFNGDSIYDLAVGVRGEDIGIEAAAGAVNVIYSDWQGLTYVGNQFWHQDVSQVRGKAEAGDSFGSSLVAADFNGDTYYDLAIGVPHEGVVRAADVGAVNVLYGFHEGLITLDNQLWHQDIFGVRERAETGDWFGFDVSAGDYNGDGYYDLAVGVPREKIAGLIGAGAAHVFHGTPTGLTDEGDQVWHQNIVRDRPELWDQMGAALGSGDYDGDGYYDLTIGAFNDSPQAVNGGGLVNVLYGNAGVGLRAVGSQVWHQNSRHIRERIELFDWFGFAVSGP